MLLIAGLSEIFLLSALGFAFYTNLKQSRSILAAVALMITASAAVMGFLRYLELADTISLHQTLSFYAKHIAMAGFLLGILWARFTNSMVAYGLLALALSSLIINLITPIGITSDATIVGLSGALIYQLRQHKTAMIQACSALALLLSTLIWGIIIQDESLRTGVFHLCLGSFFILMSSASRAFKQA